MKGATVRAPLYAVGVAIDVLPPLHPFTTPSASTCGPVLNRTLIALFEFLERHTY